MNWKLETNQKELHLLQQCGSKASDVGIGSRAEHFEEKFEVKKIQLIFRLKISMSFVVWKRLNSEKNH